MSASTNTRIEWDMINIIRDIYGRLVLGQYYLPGGQGPGLQQARDPSNSSRFEQTKVVDNPLQGGGILPNPSDFPRRVLTEIGMSPDEIIALEEKLIDKRSAKDQKESFCDVYEWLQIKLRAKTECRNKPAKKRAFCTNTHENPRLLHYLRI